MKEQLALLPSYLTAHVQLTLLALLCSTAVSLPLGLVVTRVKWLERPVLALAAIIQTVPSLALLAIMVPLLATFNFQSIGFLPAFIGLTLYGILPILRNTVTGIANVDPALLDAAKAVGMTPSQQLYRVELPIAMPMIIAGLRTATAWTVGVATLSTPVGATSLGNYIFSGLQTRNHTSVLIGCVAAAILALVLDGLVRGLEISVRKRQLRQFFGLIAALATLYLYLGFNLATTVFLPSIRPVTIGAKGFTEQYILAEILGQWIENETGRPSRQMQSLGSMVAFDALVAGDVDAYVDYTGTLWSNVMGRPTVGGNRTNVLAEIRTFLASQHGIQIAATLGFENAYAIAARAPDAETLGLTKISDLIPLGNTLSMGGDFEFFSRPEWRSIQDIYGLTFQEQRTMDAALMYQAAASGAVDLISAYTTDGRISAYNLRVLDDDRFAIPPYDAVILVSEQAMRRWPDVFEAISALNGTIDVEAMREMNLAVDEEGIAPERVAASYLAKLRTSQSPDITELNEPLPSPAR